MVIAGAPGARAGTTMVTAKTVSRMSFLIPGWGYAPGSGPRAAPRTDVVKVPVLYFRPVAQNEMTKRLMWSGLIAGIGALASIAANRIAASVWRRIFDEDPPE